MPAAAALPEPAAAELDRLAPADVVVAVLAYNAADTLPAVLATAAEGARAHLPGVRTAAVVVDAGSSDGTREAALAAPLPAAVLPYEAPAGERVAVPFHGVPGRGVALRTAFLAAQRLGARAVVLLEADVVTATPDWMARLARPVLDEKADFVAGAYVRHRWEGTISRLLLSPLVRTLYGRRLEQPLGGQQALSARLVEHLLVHPKWNWNGADVSDLWITGTAIADGFVVWEAWLGPYAVRSATRTADLPTMIRQTLGATFTLMDRHVDLWLEVQGSEPLPTVGEPAPPGVEPMTVDVERMLDGFRLGVRDLGSIWELILAPDTLGEVLALDAPGRAVFRFPDELWARVVFDFALGHHYGVVHRDHLLRSLTPLYLGRTAAFVLATRSLDAAGTQAALDAVAAAFERQKRYLVEHWI